MELEDDTPGHLAYNAGGYTSTRQPLDIFRSLILYNLWTERCKQHFDDQYSMQKFFSKPRWRRLRSVWPLGRLLDLTAPPDPRTFRVVLSLLLGRNGYT